MAGTSNVAGPFATNDREGKLPVQDYVPDCVARLLQQQVLHGAATHDGSGPLTQHFDSASVLFLDIAGFTGITEKLAGRGEGPGAELLSFVLNRYLELLVRWVEDPKR